MLGKTDFCFATVHVHVHVYVFRCVVHMYMYVCLSKENVTVVYFVLYFSSDWKSQLKPPPKDTRVKTEV